MHLLMNILHTYSPFLNIIYNITMIIQKFLIVIYDDIFYLVNSNAYSVLCTKNTSNGIILINANSTFLYTMDLKRSKWYNCTFSKSTSFKDLTNISWSFELYISLNSSIIYLLFTRSLTRNKSSWLSKIL